MLPRYHHFCEARATAATKRGHAPLLSPSKSCCRWMRVLLLVIAAANRGCGCRGVDGFVAPTGLAGGVASYRTSQSSDGRGRMPERSRRTKTSNGSSITRLGAGVILPLPLPTTPRLSGRALMIAESWAPTVGVITATLLYLAPAKAVWCAIRKARKQRFDDNDDPMNGLNPLPIAIMPSAALSWFVYGLVSHDPYLILGNLPGSLLSVAYLIGILPLMNYNTSEFPALIDDDNENADKNSVNVDKSKNHQTTNKKTTKKSRNLFLTHAAVFLSTASTIGLWATLGLMTAGATDGMFNVGGLEFGMGFSSMLRNGVIGEASGVYAALVFIVFSGSPLSAIRTVQRAKDSKMILWTLAAAQCINSGFWTAYGLVVRDHFVWGPNIIGLGLGLIQLSLKILYPSKKVKQRTKTDIPLEASSSTV